METDKRTYLLRLRMKDVTYTVECLPEDLEVRGNAVASGDDEQDREVEDAILADLEGGNPWAWCCVRVTARVGPFEGVDTLGGCSYRDEQAFRDCGYFDDMKFSAFDDLADKIESAGGVLER